MKKILIVMIQLRLGGAERSLINLLQEMDQENCQVDLLLIKKRGELLEQVPADVRVLETPFELKCIFSNKIQGIRGIPYWLCRLISVLFSKIYCFFSPSDETAIRWKLYRHLVPKYGEHYDYAISYLKGPCLYYVAEKVDADEKVAWFHNDFVKEGSDVKNTRPFLGSFHHIISVSDGCVETLKKVFPEYSDRISYMPNIVSPTVIRRNALEFVPKEYGEKPVVLSVGRLVHQKGFDIAIRAAKILKARNIPFQWFVLGEGTQRDSLEQQISQCDVRDCFILLGARNNPYPYIQNASVIVQPSRYEGKSMLLDEAKILARPIIATNYSTVRDQITNTQEGMIVEMNPASLADAVETMQSDQSHATTYSAYLAPHDYGNTYELARLYALLPGIRSV